MSRFADLTVSAFMDALASAEPTPGGGTAAAVAGAMGTSLLMMVAGLPKSRTGTDEARVALAESRAALAATRERLAALADADTEAFNQVLAAYRRPRTSDEEKAARSAAIQAALTGATAVPLDTLRATADAMRLAAVVAQHGNPSASSDAAVGVGLLEAAAAGAAANVRTNLASLRDAAFRSTTARTVDELTARVSADADTARQQLLPTS